MPNIAELWRHPVKSMVGERVGSAHLDADGLRGDRRYAVVDPDTGRIVSRAWDARWWADLLRCRAVGDVTGVGSTDVHIELPDGSRVRAGAAEADARLSAVLGQAVQLRHGPPHTDIAAVHLVTTSTLARLAELEPTSRFDVRRFRPNLVVATDGDGFVEQRWLGCELMIGDGVRLRVTDHCPRCVQTMLPQIDLPHDRAVLRTAARHNDANVGVYAHVVRTGTVRVGDPVKVVT